QGVRLDVRGREIDVARQRELARRPAHAQRDLGAVDGRAGRGRQRLGLGGDRQIDAREIDLAGGGLADDVDDAARRVHRLAPDEGNVDVQVVERDVRVELRARVHR